MSLNALLATDLAGTADRVLGSALEGAATVYDTAADAASYAAIRDTLVEVAQRADWHRLFGGHDPVAMWRAVQDALPNDSAWQELQGYLTAFTKDVVTPNGLPLVTLSPATFDAITGVASEWFGVGKELVADAITFTATEGLGAAIGAVAVTLGWTSVDKEKFAAMAASVGLASAAAASPLGAIVAVVALARVYQQARFGGDVKAALKGLTKGTAGTLAFLGAVSLVPGPLWVVVVSGVVLAILARRGAERVPMEEVEALMLRWLEWARERVVPSPKLLEGAVGDG